MAIANIMMRKLGNRNIDPPGLSVLELSRELRFLMTRAFRGEDEASAVIEFSLEGWRVFSNQVDR
ncbi:MAG: hypothetical protein DMG15_04745 [Acidobacteria bacterium]|nr:MAG: hypothetical protein DMG15_04745 [Acidobacteriota bacterium]